MDETCLNISRVPVSRTTDMTLAPPLPPKKVRKKEYHFAGRCSALTGEGETGVSFFGRGGKGGIQAAWLDPVDWLCLVGGKNRAILSGSVRIRFPTKGEVSAIPGFSHVQSANRAMI